MPKKLVFDTEQSTTPYDERPVREVWESRKKELAGKDMLTENWKVGDKVVIDMDKPFHSEGKTYPVECEVKGIEEFEYKYVAVLESADGRRFLATRPTRTVRASVSELNKILTDAEYSNKVYDVGETIRTSDGSEYEVLGVTEMAYHLRDKSGWEVTMQRPFVDSYGKLLPTFEEGKGARLPVRSAELGARWLTLYSGAEGFISVPAGYIPYSTAHGMFFATPSGDTPYEERKPEKTFRDLWEAGVYLGIPQDKLREAWANFPESASSQMHPKGASYSSHACARCSRPLRKGTKVLDDGEHLFCSKRCAEEEDDPIGHQEAYELPEEPEESDLVTSDNETYYQDGKEVLSREKGGDRSVWYYRGLRGQWVDLGTFGDDDDAAVKAYMERTQFFPNVWFQDDHGGWTLRSATHHVCSSCKRLLRKGTKVLDDGRNLFCSERCAHMEPEMSGVGDFPLTPRQTIDCTGCGRRLYGAEGDEAYWDSTGRAFCEQVCAEDYWEELRGQAPGAPMPGTGPNPFSRVKEEPGFDPDISIRPEGAQKGGRRGR